MGGERRRVLGPAVATSWRRGSRRSAEDRDPQESGLPVGEAPLAFGPAVDADALLGYQRTAGNHAVSMAIQRAAGDPPGDETAGSAGPTGATTAVSVAPSAGATTAVSVAGPASPQGPGATSRPAGPGQIVPVGGGGTIGQGGPVGPGEAGAVDQTAIRRLRKNAMEVPDFAVDAAYRADPSRVFRSPSDQWHYDLWTFQKGPGQGDEPPIAFRAGNLIAVAPGYQGSATALPSYSGDDATGLGTPGPAQTGAPSAAPVTTGTAAGPSPERPFTRAIAPGFMAGPEPEGRPTAVAASHDEVVAALAANPRSVVRSPNDSWHSQGFELDHGQGSAPTAYKVGNVIIIAPTYPADGLPATPGTASVVAIPGSTAATSGATTAPSGPATSTTAPAAGAPAAPVTVPAPGTASPTTDAATTERRVKTDVSATKDAPGVATEVMVEDVTTQGGTTTTKGRGGTLTIGGGDVIAVGGQQVVTTATGDSSTAVKTAGSLTLKPDGQLAAGGERTTDTFEGTDQHGEPIRTGSTSTFGAIDVGEKGVGVSGGMSQTDAAGTKQTVSGGVKISDGNVSGELGYAAKSAGGTSVTTSVSGGIEVKAEDPAPATGGGFDVSYTYSDSKGFSAGAGQQLGSGGPSASLQFGSTSASLQTGRRHFADEGQAKAFRDNAAALIVREELEHHAPTTVQGALEIPPGEERGTGDVSGSSIGGSVSMEGASVGYGRSSSETHRFSVKHVAGSIVQVTGIVSGTKGSDWSISGGMSNTKGSSETKGFQATWQFDLAQADGRDAFERYTQSGLPPMGGATLLSVTSSASDEDHDNYSIPLLGTAKWTGTAWEVVTTDDTGTHEQFGGQQAHDQDPSWLGSHVFGQDKIHSTAQIVANVEGDPGGDQKTTYSAQVKVSGDSGDANREELGKMFTGVGHEGTAKASGEWTLTAKVSPAVVRELEKVHKEMRDALTWEDKMRVYSKLIKENGAAMVGAQVGMGSTSTAWNVELKGDRNFPGEAGRMALDARRADLRGRLDASPANARDVFRETQRTLEELHARRDAVADQKRYTDLPDGLRDEQLRVIDKHISDFELVSHFAAQAAIQVPAEGPASAQGQAASGSGYEDADQAAEAAEMTRLLQRIGEQEAAIKAIDPRMHAAIDAVLDAKGRFRVLPTGARQFQTEHAQAVREHWDIATTLNDRQSAMAPKADVLRAKLLGDLTPSDRKATAESLLTVLTDRSGLLESMFSEVMSTAEALKPITTDGAMALHETFWAGVTGDTLPDGSEDD